jgi:hypothetical protein
LRRDELPTGRQKAKPSAIRALRISVRDTALMRPANLAARYQRVLDEQGMPTASSRMFFAGHLHRNHDLGAVNRPPAFGGGTRKLR